MNVVYEAVTTSLPAPCGNWEMVTKTSVCAVRGAEVDAYSRETVSRGGHNPYAGTLWAWCPLCAPTLGETGSMLTLLHDASNMMMYRSFKGAL